MLKPTETTIEPVVARPVKLRKNNQRLSSVGEGGSASGGRGQRSLQPKTATAAPDLRLAHETVSHAESQLARLTQLWPGVLFTQNPDFSVRSCRGKAEELTGLAPAAWSSPSQRFWDIVHEADHYELRHQCAQAVKTMDAVTATFRIRHSRTGRVAYVLENRQAMLGPEGELLGYEVAWLDVTRQTIAEKRLASAAWKETLALLTMGLAHDFNNVMAGILSFAELMMAKAEPESPNARPLQLIKQGALQASELIRRIVNLHRCKTGTREYLDLNQVVPDVVQLVCKVLPRSIKVQTELAPKALPVYMDGVGFRQVALNLALNAADAMPQGGVLTFRLSAHEGPCALTHSYGNFPRLPCVCLSLQDTGSGISTRHLPHLFDPFFTTKPLTKGSGLGLYNARLFVEEHAGAISVESTEGGGATFRLWLPQADFSEAETQAAQNALRRRNLLLVGQPGAATESVAELLRTHNFAVVTTYSPARALELVAAGETPHQAVLVVSEPQDQAMMGLVSELRARRHSSRVALHLLGGTSDDLETEFLNKADLVLDGGQTDLTVLIKKLEALCVDSPA